MLKYLCCAMFLLAGPAHAYQQFSTLRVAGVEILSVTRAPQQDEDPAGLTLQIARPGDTPAEIFIESDGDLDGCYDQLIGIQGARATYAEIVTDINAVTMNGVLVVQCTAYQFPFGDN